MNKLFLANLKRKIQNGVLENSIFFECTWWIRFVSSVIFLFPNLVSYVRMKKRWQIKWKRGAVRVKEADRDWY